MLRTTMGQMLVNNALPEDMRDHSRVLDKKGISTLLRELAQKHPEQYAEVSHKLSNIGRDVATEFGGYTFGLEHLRKSAAGLQYQDKIKKFVKQTLDRDDLTPKQQQDIIVRMVGSTQQKQIDDTYAEAVKSRNPLALQVVSGSRGNKMNLASLLSSDSLYADHRDEVIPLPVTSSYSQGLKPVEYWAATYGARKGTMATKFATQDAGFLCLARGTLVRKPDGTSSPIETIKVGDTVLGADSNGKVFPVKVTGAFDNGPRDVWRYKFRAGKSRNTYVIIEATEDHKVLAKMKRGRVGTVHGDKNSITVPTQLPLSRASTGFRLVPSQGYKCGQESDGIAEPYGLMLGLLLGDGCLTTNDITFSAADEGLVAYINNHYADAGFELTKVESHKYEYRLQDRNPNAYTHDKVVGNRYAAGFRHRFRAWLDRFGLLGHKAHEKFIPAEVYQWQLDSVAELLAGLFETDGCISATNNSSVPAISLFMTSKKIVETVRDLLQLKFGIFACAVRHIPKENYVNANHDVYGIVINDWASVHRFNAAILLPGRKQEILDIAVKRMTTPTRADEFMYGFVTKEFLGIRATYDIEVDHPDHLFVLANGAIVSNSKQLNQVAHRLMIVDEDDPRDLPNRGLPVDTDDTDNEGSLLAQDVGPYKKNTVLTPKILKHLKGIGHDRLLVRSPLVGGSPDGGVYARDVGVRERGVLPSRGEQVGLTAAQALSEPLSQGQLSAKHSGGVAGQEKAVGGFAYINQLIQVPKKFKGGAAHAEHDGNVTLIQPAPAGGHYVFVGPNRHYVPTDVPLKVKKGDTVEAGDVLSEGFPNPAIVTQHKGVGEGKRYFVNAMRQAMSDAGMKSNRRNIEILARGLINHVRLNEEFANHVPDDVVPYSTLEHLYEPREGHAMLDPRRAIGKYLERPVLHYSIGTKVRPSVLKELQHFGVNEVAVHDDPPPFQSEMIRGMYSLRHDPDWMTRMYGSGLKDSLLDSVHRGGVSDEQGTSFVPSLARAVDFGRTGGAVQTPDPVKPLPPEGQPFGDPRKVKPVTPIMSAPPAPEKKKPGLFSGIFKTSVDAKVKAPQKAKTVQNTKPIQQIKLMRQAHQIKLADAVAKPSVTTSTPSYAGSSTDASATKTNPVAGIQSAAPAHDNAINMPKPDTNAMKSNVGTSSQSNALPEPPQQTPSAPSGQIHPARMTGQQPYESMIDQQYGPAQQSGYTPGQGLMSQTDSPELAAQFVQGGGNPDDPSSGFGGELGAVARFGSLLDTNAVATLTGGENYRQYQRPQGPQYHHDLLGGGNLHNPQAVPENMPALGGVMKPEPAASPANPTSSPASNFSPLNLAVRTLASPATSPAALKALGGVTKPLMRQVFKETEEAAAKAAAGKLAKQGIKAVSKRIPGVGWIIEGVGAAMTPEEELRAKFEEKAKMEATAGNTLGHFADSALNPGENLRAATIALQDVKQQNSESNRSAIKADANFIAHKNALIRQLETAKASRPLTPEESAKLQQSKQQVAEMTANNQSGWLDRQLSDRTFRPRDEQVFADHVRKQDTAARLHAGEEQLRLGEASVEKVLNDQAQPHESDAFKAWLEGQKDPVTKPRVNGGFVMDGQVTPYTPDDHATLDQHAKRYLDLATRFAAKGMTEEAKVLQARADEIGASSAVREQRLQEQAVQQQAAKRKKDMEQMYQPWQPKPRPQSSLFQPPTTGTFPRLGGIGSYTPLRDNTPTQE